MMRETLSLTDREKLALAVVSNLLSEEVVLRGKNSLAVHLIPLASLLLRLSDPNLEPSRKSDELIEISNIEESDLVLKINTICRRLFQPIPDYDCIEGGNLHDPIEKFILNHEPANTRSIKWRLDLIETIDYIMAETVERTIHEMSKA